MTKKDKSGIAHLEYNRINWFPGHMHKAQQDIKKQIKQVNIIVEVRDARAPLASGNKSSYQESGNKPYLIVVNKTNLADPAAVKLWQEWFATQDEPVIFINALDKNSIKLITSRAREIVRAHRLKANPEASELAKMKMMILGLPNTGKSTIINKLANRTATKAASTPGETKQKLWVNVDDTLELLDTPGIMPPRIDQQIQGMWLSAIHAIPDYVVTPDDSASFIIGHMLKTKSQVFKDYYKLESFDVDVLKVIEHIGKIRGCLGPGGTYNYDKIFNLVLNDFRKGILGQTSFELPPTK